VDGGNWIKGEKGEPYLARATRNQPNWVTRWVRAPKLGNRRGKGDVASEWEGKTPGVEKSLGLFWVEGKLIKRGGGANTQRKTLRWKFKLGGRIGVKWRSSVEKIA